MNAYDMTLHVITSIFLQKYKKVFFPFFIHIVLDFLGFNVSEVTGMDPNERFFPDSRVESTRGDSFHTIASVGSNSAVVHYQPEKDSCKSLERNNIFLIDAW